MDRLAARLRPALTGDLPEEFDEAAQAFKGRIAQRMRSVAQQLRSTKQPVHFPDGGVMRLTGWSFKGGPNHPSTGSQRADGLREVLRVESGGATESSGAWRTTLFLDAGHFEFTGMARTEGSTSTKGTNGVMLRISGERSTNGIAISREWKTLNYEFDVRGLEDVELVCEFRGEQGWGEFDARSLRLVRKGPPLPPVAAP